MRKKGTMIVLVLLLVFQNLLFGMVGFANEEDSTEIPEQDETIIEQPEHPEEDESDTGLEEDESVIDPEDGESTVTNEVYGPRSIQSGNLPVQLTDVQVFYFDDEGKQNPIPITETSRRLELGETVRIEYQWELPEDHEGSSGDTFEFSIPEEFEIFSEITGDLAFGGEIVGSFKVATDNKVTMTFGEILNGKSGIAGSLWFESEIREDLHNIPTETEIRFPLTDGMKSIPVKFKPKGGSLIEKEGEAYPQAYDGTHIKWTIDVNTVLNPLDGATVYDEIPEGLELELDTVEVYKLKIDVSGNPVGEPELITLAPEDNRSNLSTLDITLGDIDSAYRITFSTKVTADWVGKKSFENIAELKDGSDQVLDHSSAIVVLEKSPPLAKVVNGYDRATQTIEWEIQYNYNKREINQENAVITDKLESEFVPDGVKWTEPEVFEVQLDSTGREIPGSASPVDKSQYSIEWIPDEQSKAGFIIRFNKDISSPHKIVYTTQITGQVLDDTKVSNKVKIGLEGDTIEWIAPVEQGIHQGILRKYLRGTDYYSKTNNWEITINENGYDLEDLVVTDTLSGNLKYVQGSIKVDGIDSNVYDFDETPTGFTITFNEKVSNKLTITYQTKFERAKDLNLGAFQNKVGIDWEGKYRETNPVPFNPNEYTQKNGFKKGDYDAQTKKITWDIGVNYNLNVFENLIVEDLIEEGQTLVEGSVEVFEMNIASNGNPTKGVKVEEGFDVTYIENNGDDEDNILGFRIQFNQQTNKAYWISFQSNLDQQLITEWYNNTATLKDGSDTFAILDARVKVEHGDEYVFKKGVQQGRGIDWEIWINRNQSTIHAGAKIIDYPEGSQVLLEDSFKLYGTTVSKDGAVKKDEDNLLVEGENGDYTLEFKDDGSFEITFLKDMTESYVLEYTSFFTGKDGDTVKNEVEFIGEGSKKINKEITESIRVRLSTGGGDIIGKTGSLTLIKVDAINSEKKLEGAKFELYLRKNTGLVLIDTQMSNQNGEVKFENLLLREYILKEIEAPANYQLDETEIPIDLTSGSITDLPISNLHKDSPISKLGDYVWLDSNRNGIQDEQEENGVNGVKVELYKEEGGNFGDTPYKTTETANDKDGKPGYYLFDQLPPGHYKVCFKLPEGYKFTTPLAEGGTHPDKDSDAIPSDTDPIIGCSNIIKLGLNEFIDTIDAGLVLGRLGDYVWLDSNRNGIQDEPDLRGFDGVKVELYKKNDDKDDFEKIAETVTAKDENGKPGYYLFDDLLPGEYKVKFELPRGFAFTRKEVQNGKDGEISKAYYNGWTDEISLEAGEEDLTIDAGLVVLFGSDDDDDGDNGGSNPPPTTPPGKENPKDKDPKEKDPKDPNKGTPGDHTDGDEDGVPANPPAPGSDSGDTGESGGTDGDNGEKTNNPPVQGETAPKDKGRTLPQTGENPSLLPLLGLFFCVAGAILWYRRKPQLN